jgi:SNF2 family DNA or RNA helicase
LETETIVPATQLKTLIDNRPGNLLIDAVRRLIAHSKSLDIATGFFEIGSLVDLDGSWQDLTRLRLLMGDEVNRRTKAQLVDALRSTGSNGIERAKSDDDWAALRGLKAIRGALLAGLIEPRVYTRAKFHAKAFHFKTVGLVNHGIIGSSNFTHPGLTQNVELNILTHDPSQLDKLAEWYESVWNEAEDIKDDLLRIIEPHVRSYSPFEAYLKTLHDYFAGREKAQDAWETNHSVIYDILSQYQKDGYHRALQIADNNGGALVCDGVGLGKTFIGLMILERRLYELRRRMAAGSIPREILLIVPKSAEQSVWRANIERYLEPEYGYELDKYLRVLKHTDFGRPGTIDERTLRGVKNHVGTIIIDEAHHFRNPSSNRGKLLKEICEDKQMFMLTATPINNSLFDLFHLINYFAQDRKDHFRGIGILDLRGYFRNADKRMEQDDDRHTMGGLFESDEFEDFIKADRLLKEVLIQRSRRYVKESEALSANAPIFPERQMPRVIDYSLRGVYESIYSELKDAFDKDNPFLTLAIYNTTAYELDPDPREAQRQKQVIGLIRTLLLKRLESSFKSFEASTEDLLVKMATFVRTYARDRFDAWDSSNRRWWSIVQTHVRERLDSIGEADEEEEDNEIPDDEVARFSPETHDMDRMIADIEEDMRLLTDFLSKIYRRFYVQGKEGVVIDPTKDDKLQQLLEKLGNDELLKGSKVLIFSEFCNTAQYLYDQIKLAGFKHVEEIDSGRNVKNRETVIKRFAPYYNCRFEPDTLFDSELERMQKQPIEILISTDVLSEGLNLQDASVLINYDLHWNPVRLMQRIGRVDRRLNSGIEAVIERPAKLRGKIYFWNFLPPNELEEILKLRQRVTGKITRINKTLGIEGALLSPDDPEMSLKEFNQSYEGQESIEELMAIERQRLALQHPGEWRGVAEYPQRVFTGKLAGAGFEQVIGKDGEPKANIKPEPLRGVFFAYQMPGITADSRGPVKWYLFDRSTGKIHEADSDRGLQRAWCAVRCVDDTARSNSLPEDELTSARKQVDGHIRNTYLRQAQTPMGLRPILLTWMEIV